MALTEEEKKELVQDVVNQIKTDSQSVDELETVSTLDGVVSLPAMRGETVVSAPVKLLSKPAEDAAVTAKASAAVADAATKAAGEASVYAEFDDCPRVGKFVKLLDFRHFERHMMFSQSDRKTYKKAISDGVNVSVVLDVGCGNT